MFVTVRWRWWAGKESFLCFLWLFLPPAMLFLTVRPQPGRSFIFNVKILLVSICFSVFHQWTQLDEKYMYRVMLHKAIKLVTRFNFCISCSTWDVRTDEEMKEALSWVVFTASELVPTFLWSSLWLGLGAFMLLFPCITSHLCLKMNNFLYVTNEGVSGLSMHRE